MAIKEVIECQLEEISLHNYLLNLILSKGKIKENGILDVTTFLNHQIDPRLMRDLGVVIGEKFSRYSPTKVLTAESSGIAPALGTAIALEIPCVFAKKIPPITLEQTYQSSAESHTKGHLTDYIVDTRVLNSKDRVLIVDDFLARGTTIEALLKICGLAQAQPVGIATAIEKSFEGGREYLKNFNLPVYSTVIITRMDVETQQFTFSEN